MKGYLLISLVILISGCSGLPKEMQNTPFTDLNLETVSSNPHLYQSMTFRWGGTIISVENKQNFSHAQILFYPLNSYGRPQIDKKTQGRFAIKSDKLLDPAIFKKEMEITVNGKLTGEIEQKIDEKTVKIPLLSLDHIHIWPKLSPEESRYPYYYPYSPHPFFYSYPYYRYNLYYDYWW